ncbi:MAG: NAD(P)-dependent oxidoreductase [Actinobacteria bacterium]|nr:NAD(P)-dependent oxidoreductase [Actinomycetota bacterium]
MTVTGVVTGLVGLGVMGAATLHRVAGQGADVVATSRSRSSRDAVAGTARATLVDTPAEVAAAVAARTPAEAPVVVLVAVTAGPQVRAVAEGPAGLLAGLPAGRRLLLVDTSTCSPADARSLHADLAALGHGALDAPVSGGPSAIGRGTLSVMAGGDAADLAAARPVLDLFAGTVVHCGGPGAGQVTKAANQLVVACTIEAVAEALALAATNGVDPALVRTALLGGYAASPVLDLAGDRMIRGDFRTVGAVSLFAKDLGIVADLAAASGVATPAADVVRGHATALAATMPDADHAALVTLFAPDGLAALAGAAAAARPVTDAGAIS